MVVYLFGCEAVLETGPDAVWRVWTDVAVHTVVSFDAEAVVTGYGAEGSACTCSGRVGAGRRVQMAATVMFLSPATRRMSPGSLVTTVIWL
jgi:hypothetical protein